MKRCARDRRPYARKMAGLMKKRDELENFFKEPQNARLNERSNVLEFLDR